MSLGMAIGAGFSGTLQASKFGRRVLHSGLVVIVIGVAGVCG